MSLTPIGYEQVTATYTRKILYPGSEVTHTIGTCIPPYTSTVIRWAIFELINGQWKEYCEYGNSMKKMLAERCDRLNKEQPGKWKLCKVRRTTTYEYEDAP